jgi:preprotein translocase subunit SecG
MTEIIEISDTNTDTSSPNTVNTGLGTVATDMYSFINSLFSNPSVVIILVVIIVIYVIIFMYLGESGSSTSTFSSTSQTESGSAKTITVMVVSIFIILVIINGLQYFFGVDIIASLKNILTGKPEIDITVDTSRKEAAKAPIPEILLRPQVYNIPENTYVYADAKALCTAYGSRLATYKEIEEAYNKGGEWCNYGWSDGQMALFPTQQKTFDELQKIEGHENDCGRPGVNGGYMSNPALRFGVNCYGYKPRMTPEEEDLMASQPIYPKTEKDIAMENRVNYWKDKLTEIIVSPFNHDTWSKL